MSSEANNSQGMDLPDVKIVVQYRTTCDLCTLWQRFGRAARAAGATAVGILLVEKKETRRNREEREVRALEKVRRSQLGGKRKRKGKASAPHTPAKRSALSDITPSSPVPPRPSAVLAARVEAILVENEGNATSESSAEDSSANEESDSDNFALIQPVVGGGDSRTSKGKRRSKVEIGNPLDLMINPESVGGCRRASPRRFFGYWDQGVTGV